MQNSSARAIRLSAEQLAVESHVHAGHHVFVSGPAGSGKSTLLNRMRERYGARLSVTASTGIAALNVGGSTLHSFAGLGKGDAPAEQIADSVVGSEGRAFRNIRSCEILAIDEVSMISGELLDKLDRVFKIVRRNESPFGGAQLVMFGDFCQLPPVSRAGDKASFAFQSPAWTGADVGTHVFTKVFRQEEQGLADAFGRLRIGDIFHPSVNLLASRNNLPLPNDGVRPVVIHTHNVDVDRANLAELVKLQKAELAFEATDTGRPEARERLNRDCLAPKTLRLREGAQVMLLANIDVEAGLVNGSLGVVIGLKPAEILVRFGKNQIVEISPKTWEIKNAGEVIAARTQYPLRLAYALTVHKCQGMTLDRIECHLDPKKVFEYGMAYVAVSRVRTLEGLFLRKSSRHAFRAHPKAVEFYRQAAGLQTAA